jgi:hypothetical protein
VEINKELILDSNNYYTNIHKKTQIVIGNTLSLDMCHFDLWKSKMNGNFKGTAPYTVTLDGKVYEHYDPKYYSESIKINDYDECVIPIVLENEGWLMKDFRNSKYLTWCGDIYNREDPVEVKWRSNMRWAPYSEKQLNSLIELCDNLINKFKIKRFVSEHNTKISNISELEGIYYRSNFSSNYLDVSPAFNFKKFKTKIENGKLK